VTVAEMKMSPSFQGKIIFERIKKRISRVPVNQREEFI
jgi:hypothetical protein